MAKSAKLAEKSKNREEIRLFYCLALKNREEIRKWVGENIENVGQNIYPWGIDEVVQHERSGIRIILCHPLPLELHHCLTDLQEPALHDEMRILKTSPHK